jgi:hypothetical protein
MRTTTMLGSALALALGAAGCDIDQTREGEMPEVEVHEGQMPEYDVQGPEVETGTETRQIEVPDVDVEMRREEVRVPTIDIDVPDDGEGDRNEPREQQR